MTSITFFHVVVQVHVVFVFWQFLNRRVEPVGSWGYVIGLERWNGCSSTTRFTYVVDFTSCRRVARRILLQYKIARKIRTSEQPKRYFIPVACAGCPVGRLRQACCLLSAGRSDVR